MRKHLKMRSIEDLDEFEKQLREADLSEVNGLEVGWQTTDDVRRPCALLERVLIRCGEMTNLDRVYYTGGASEEVLDAVASIVLECRAVHTLSFVLNVVSLTGKTIQACCSSSIKHLRLCFGRHTKQSMVQLCERLCERSEPLQEFDIELGNFDRDATAVLFGALSGMRLESLDLAVDHSSLPFVQEDYQLLFKALAKCIELKTLSLIVAVAPRGQGTLSSLPSREAMSLDESVFSSVLRAIPQMISLRMLRWYGPVNLSKDQWFQFGKTVAKCPRLTTFAVHYIREQTEMDAFFDGCGPHPRLLHVDLGRLPLVVGARIQQWHTSRARCLTVLLVGSSIQRAGEHSLVYKIPTDIFRRLRLFLTDW